MQSVQFLVEDGDCHRRNGNLGLALKRYFAVQKVFNEVEDDQYDFHGYSMRKFTLNVYMEFVHLPNVHASTALTIHLASSAGRIAFGCTQHTFTLPSPHHRSVLSPLCGSTTLMRWRRYTFTSTTILRCRHTLQQVVRWFHRVR